MKKQKKYNKKHNLYEESPPILGFRGGCNFHVSLYHILFRSSMCDIMDKCFRDQDNVYL